MQLNMEELLALPERERRLIAETLWRSLSPIQGISSEETEVIEMLDERWQNIQAGKSTHYSPAELQMMIKEYRKK